MAKRKFEVLNLYEHVDKKYITKAKCKQLLPGILEHEFRLGVVGGSGSGKTNFLANLLMWMGAFDKKGMFKKIIYVCPTKQPLIIAAMDAQPKRIYICETLAELPEVDHYNAEGPSLIIFDDLMSCSRTDNLKIERWFLKSRIRDCSCVYIGQNYFKIPKLVRQQFTHIILKRINSVRDIDRIMAEHNDDAPPNFVRECYMSTVKQPQGFFLITLVGNGPKFRDGFGNPFEVPSIFKEKPAVESKESQQ